MRERERPSKLAQNMLWRALLLIQVAVSFWLHLLGMLIADDIKFETRLECGHPPPLTCFPREMAVPADNAWIGWIAIVESLASLTATTWFLATVQVYP